MSSLASEVIDLFASGEREKIECVVFAAGAGAVTGGLAAGLAFAPSNVVPVAGTAFNGAAAGIGAVVGAVGATKLAIKACGAQSTNGALERLFSIGQAPSDAVNAYETAAIQRYGISEDQARLLTKAAVVNFGNASDTDATPTNVSPIAERHAVLALIGQLQRALG